MYRVIDDAGTVIGYLEQGDKVIKNASIQAFKRIRKSEESPECMMWKPEDGFVKLYPDALDAIHGVCSKAEISFICRISRFISYRSGILKHVNGKAVTAESMAEVCGYDKSVIYKLIKSLNKKNIIYIGRNDNEVQYYINPYVFFRGNHINTTLTAMFADPKDRV